MDYDEAMMARVSPREAIAECRKHGIKAKLDGSYLVAYDEVNGRDLIAELGRDGLIKGSKLLGWLGY